MSGHSHCGTVLHAAPIIIRSVTEHSLHALPICQSLQHSFTCFSNLSVTLTVSHASHCSTVSDALPRCLSLQQFSFTCSSHVYHCCTVLSVTVAQFHMLFLYACHCSTVSYASQCGTVSHALPICLSLQYSFTCQSV